MAGEDQHEDCVRCLGLEHAIDAVNNTGDCSLCRATATGIKARRLVRAKASFTGEWRDRVRDEEQRRGNEERDARDPARYCEDDYRDLPTKAQARRAVEAAEACPDDGEPGAAAADAPHHPPPPRELAVHLPPIEDGPSTDEESMEEGDEDGDGSSSYDDDSSSGEDDYDEPEPLSGHYGTPRFEAQLRAALQAAAGAQVEAAAAAAPPEPAQEPAQPPPPPLEMDQSPLVDIFKKAAARGGLKWPTEEVPVAPGEDWVTINHGFQKKEAPAAKRVQVLPLAKGFTTALSAAWKRPNSFSFPPEHKMDVDCAGAEAAGLGGMPAMDKHMAAHLLRKPDVTWSKEPVFPGSHDKDVSSIAKKAYWSMTLGVKAVNAIALLQGSTSHVLQAMGDNPTLEHLLELRRLHLETMYLTKYSTEMSGRAMAHLVVLERSRWLNLTPKFADRLTTLDQPILQTNLFSGSLPDITARHEQDSKQKEALRAYMPTEPPRPSYNKKPIAGRSREKRDRGFERERDYRPPFKSPEPARAASASSGPRQKSYKGDKQRRKPSASPAGRQRGGGAGGGGGRNHDGGRQRK